MMKFYIKFHVRLYKILCSLVFFLTSISLCHRHGTDLLCVSLMDNTNEVFEVDLMESLQSIHAIHMILVHDILLHMQQTQKILE